MPGPDTYNVPIGSELLLDHLRWRVVGRDSDGYAVEGQEDGERCVLSGDRITKAIEAGDCHVTTPAMSEKRKKLSNYTSGIEHIAQLPEEEQKTSARARASSWPWSGLRPTVPR